MVEVTDPTIASAAVTPTQGLIRDVQAMGLVAHSRKRRLRLEHQRKRHQEHQRHVSHHVFYHCAYFSFFDLRTFEFIR
jgi:hypothetical protein